jgi:hypothetical protein
VPYDVTIAFHSLTPVVCACVLSCVPTVCTLQPPLRSLKAAVHAFGASGRADRVVLMWSDMLAMHAPSLCMKDCDLVCSALMPHGHVSAIARVAADTCQRFGSVSTYILNNALTAVLKGREVARKNVSTQRKLDVTPRHQRARTPRRAAGTAAATVEAVSEGASLAHTWASVGEECEQLLRQFVDSYRAVPDAVTYNVLMRA